MKITFDVAMEIAAHEAIIRQAYKDSVGVWTWSVGLTSATGHDVSRYIGKPQSLEHCLKIYVWALERYAEGVRKAFKGHTLTESQFAAALSFHWNTGKIATASWVPLFKAGKLAEAEKSLKSWCKAGGKVSSGLVSRRKREADLLFRGKWSHGGTMVEYTRLTAKSTPDWASARRVDVTAALQAALGDSKPVVPDVPDAPVTVPADESWFTKFLKSLLAALRGAK
jgi:lysozyme